MPKYKREWANNIENCKKELLEVLKRNNCELIADDFLNVIIRDIKTMKDEKDLISMLKQKEIIITIDTDEDTATDDEIDNYIGYILLDRCISSSNKLLDNDLEIVDISINKKEV